MSSISAPIIDYNVDDSTDDLSLDVAEHNAPTNVSTTPKSVPSIGNYTYGLTGVNVGMDNATSQALYLSIGIICIVVTTVRLLQRASGHLRQITTLGGSDPQVFWTEDRSSWWPVLKRNLFYAPLKHKRHNRELQISRAYNMGTIPGRFHTLLLSLYLISNVAYMSILNYSEPQYATLAELRGRSGHLSILNMIALFIMAGRNNPFIRILRVSFDTFNLFHRWIGRLVIIEAVIHTIAWAAVKVQAAGWAGVHESLSSPFIQWGTASVIAMILISIQAPSVIRHAFYETFLHLHQLLAFIALLGVYFHAKLGSLPQFGFVIFIALIWKFDRISRLAILLYRNISWKKGMTTVVVEALPGEACRVTFHPPRAWTPAAGSHVYAYLPSISLWQSHPFSVAWTTSTDSLNNNFTRDDTTCTDLEKTAQLPIPEINATTISLVMAARTGMTRKLYARAASARNGRFTTRGLLEGPYGALESLHSYGTVVLFAGGVGITHHLPHVRDLLQRRARGTISTQKIVLVWSIRSTDSLEWVRPWMDEILAMPGRREALKMMIFVTRPKSPRDVVSASERVQMFPGRLKPGTIVEKEFRDRVGAMCVGVCGPGAFADDVRDAARAVVERGKVDFWEEGFTW